MYLHIHTTINYQFTYVFSENIFNIYSYDDFKHFLQWWLFSNSDQQLLGHPRYRSEKIRTYSNEIFQWKKNWHTFVTKWNFLVPKKNCILDFSSQQNNVNFVEDHTGWLISHVQWVLKKVSSILHLILQYQCGKPIFSNTRQNGEWTETSTPQNEIEFAIFGEWHFF